MWCPSHLVDNDPPPTPVDAKAKYAKASAQPGWNDFMRMNAVADALAACKIDKRRWPSFDKALTSLYESEMLHERSN